jgi:hypothetical protein
MQGNLFEDRRRFNSYELADMQRALENLDKRLNAWQPLQLLCIVQKIKSIG